jgi:hypothetical protein
LIFIFFSLRFKKELYFKGSKMTKNIKKMLFMIGFLGMQSAFAQVPVSFPANPWNSTWAPQCDQAVYNTMYNKAKADYDKNYTSLEKSLVKDQAERTPKGATNKALACVDGAAAKLDGIVTAGQSIVNLLLGTIDMGKIGGDAMNTITNQACNMVDSYLTNTINSATGPYVSTVTSLPGQTASMGNVSTPLGNVNVGSAVLGQAQQGSTATNTQPVTNAVNSMFK